jgi:hypothetical protein
MTGEIIIPYSPRYPQTEIHQTLEANRFTVLVAHRRMGKTVCVINHLIKQALTQGKKDGSYGYVAPLRTQAKAIAWSYLKHFTEPLAEYGRVVNESELYVRLPGGATVRLFGADNPDSLRGLYFDGVVLDEVAQMKGEVWGEIIQPALADRQGFAVFIGTPKGINLFSELYYKAVSGSAPGWHGTMYRATETGVLAEEELERLRAEMSPNAWRQEMLCDFSAAADDTLIPIDLVETAAKKTHHISAVSFSPVVLGVDVARFGDDASVIVRRQGLASAEPLVLRGLNNMEVADRVGQEIHTHRPRAVFIDAGRGEGVIDRLRQLGFSVVEVNFGAKASEPGRYVNKRSEMWARLAQWLKDGGAIYNHLGLKAELSAPTYYFDHAGRLGLEAKEKIKERLGKSPDVADALALTFAAMVGGPDIMPSWTAAAQDSYNPLEY